MIFLDTKNSSNTNSFLVNGVFQGLLYGTVKYNSLVPYCPVACIFYNRFRSSQLPFLHLNFMDNNPLVLPLILQLFTINIIPYLSDPLLSYAISIIAIVMVE